MEDGGDGGAHRDLDQTGAGDRAAEADQLGAGGIVGAGVAEPVDAEAEEVGQVAEGFDVVDHGGAAPEAALGGEGRAQAGDGAAAFDAFEENGFLAADVAAGAATDLDAEARGVTSPMCAGGAGLMRAGGAGAQNARFLRLGEGGGKALMGERRLPVDVDEGEVHADGVGGDADALDQAMGVGLHEGAVLEDAGLPLLGVDDEDRGAVAGGSGAGGAPLAVDGEVGPATAAQAGGFYRVDDLLGRDGERRLEADVGASGPGLVEGGGVDVASPGEEAAGLGREKVVQGGVLGGAVEEGTSDAGGGGGRDGDGGGTGGAVRGEGEDGGGPRQRHRRRSRRRRSRARRRAGRRGRGPRRQRGPWRRRGG